jgi:hypothetical protein
MMTTRIASSAASMTTPEIEQLTADCTQLRLTKVAATLPTLLEKAAARDLSYRA